MPKMKPHKGLLKRIRITKTGKVKHNKAGYKHLRSSKAATRLRRLRKGSIMSTADTRRISRLLGRRLRGRTQPLSALRRSPSPSERREMRAKARAAAGAATGS
ncbi:MAG TPA: 50S ribosomal protein L35 [Phycisphaerales bacterium]|nr:50S ribosomal protein L35 [Phycisphaerales bacterium]